MRSGKIKAVNLTALVGEFRDNTKSGGFALFQSLAHALKNQKRWGFLAIWYLIERAYREARDCGKFDTRQRESATEALVFVFTPLFFCIGVR